MTTEPARSDALSISHLMLLTCGIAVSFCVARGLEHFRFTVESFYHDAEAISSIDAFGMLVIAVYGLSVTIWVFAIRSGEIWSSPGKTLAVLFGTMCLLNWGLDFVAAAVVKVRLQTDVPPGEVDRRPYILGIWYGMFSVQIGYVASLPVLLWVLLKTKTQGVLWRLAWLGFLLIAILIVGYLHLGFRNYVSPSLNNVYFDVAISIPICLLIVALANSIARRQPLDWWTTMTVIPVVSVWCIGVPLRVLA